MFDRADKRGVSMSSMSIVAWAGAALLLAAGAMKLRDPQPLVQASRVLGLGMSTGAVRAICVVETVVATSAVLFGGRSAWAVVAGSYAALTAFVVLVRRHGGANASCGCFGRTATPATSSHAVVTGAYSVVAMLAAVQAAPGIARLGADQVALAAPSALVVTGLTYSVLAVLPRLRPSQG